MKKSSRRSIFFLSILSAISVFSCMPEADPNAGGDWETLSDEEKSTLESLTLVHPYPLFTMVYHADYDFVGYTPEIPLTAGEKGSVSGFDFCSCFTAYGDTANPLFGRNFDFWHRPALLLFTSPAGGYRSVSMVDLYYCGVTSETQLTRAEDRIGLLGTPYLPFDGVNEAGVSIGIMAVPYAEPPRDPEKPDLYDLGVVRMVLDCARDAEHAVDLIQSVNVIFEEIPLHYLVGDPSGRSAVVEFVDDTVRVLWNEGSYQACTNFTQTYYWPNLNSICPRYDRIINRLSGTGGALSMEEGMDLLSTVSQPHTMWSMVYQMKTGSVMAVMGRDYDQIRTFDLASGWVSANGKKKVVR